MAILVNDWTGQQQIDPSIALMNYIRDNYTITHPSKESIKFDTKFGDYSKENFIVIENMPTLATAQVLGKYRIRYTDTKRIQILCNTKSARNDIFLIMEHLDDLINANPIAMQSPYGFDEISMDEFQEIRLTSDRNITDMEVNESEDFVQRRWAIVTMLYTKRRV